MKEGLTNEEFAELRTPECEDCQYYGNNCHCRYEKEAFDNLIRENHQMRVQIRIYVEHSQEQAQLIAQLKTDLEEARANWKYWFNQEQKVHNQLINYMNNINNREEN
jgi:hypothetical protein